MIARNSVAWMILLASIFPNLLLASESDKTTTLQEITVTAQRRTASLQSVPVAVTALTTAALNNRQIFTPQAVSSLVPSLKMIYNITSPTNLSPSLRGGLTGDASSIAAESPFGVYIDGIYIARLNANNVAFNDLERVEVLRGPQGTLYGRNAMVGALNFVSRTPGSESWEDTEIDAGNYDQTRGAFSVGGPVADNWAASFAATYNHKDNEFRNVVTHTDADTEQNVAMRTKLHYMPKSGIDAVAFISYTRSENDAIPQLNGTTPNIPSNHTFDTDDVKLTFGPYNVGVPVYTGHVPYIKPTPFGDTKQTIAGVTIKYKLGAQTLQSITGYVRTQDAFSNDISGIGGTILGENSNVNEFTEELQLRGSSSGGLIDYITGAYYLRESGTQNWGWYVFGPASTSALTILTNSIALFGEANYHLTDTLTATVGGRWTEDKKSFDDSIVQLTPFGGPTAPVSLHNDYPKFTPKASLAYKLKAPSGAIDSMLIYVSATEGFQSGGYTGINITDLRNAKIPYGPETNWSYETGLKTDLFDHRLRLDAAYFYEIISNLALTSTVTEDGLPVNAKQNVGDAAINGLEFEISAVPVHGLTVFLNPTFMAGRYTRLAPTSAPALSRTLYGVLDPTPPQVPWLALAVGFDYRSDLGLVGNDRRLIAGMDEFHSARYVVTATNDMYQSPYDRVNGYVGLEFHDSLDVRLSVKNLQNRKTIISGSRPIGGFIMLPPREILLSVQDRF